MENEKVSTVYFEQQVDSREDFKEKCLAALVIVLAEIRDQLAEFVQNAKQNRIDRPDQGERR